MNDRTIDLEARIRVALSNRLGESGWWARFHRHNDTVYLEVSGMAGLERTAKLVEQALDGIGVLLRDEKIALHVTVGSSWQPRWQSQRVPIASEPDAVPAPLRRAAG